MRLLPYLLQSLSESLKLSNLPIAFIFIPILHIFKHIIVVPCIHTTQILDCFIHINEIKLFILLDTMFDRPVTVSSVCFYIRHEYLVLLGIFLTVCTFHTANLILKVDTVFLTIL